MGYMPILIGEEAGVSQTGHSLKEYAEAAASPSLEEIELAMSQNSAVTNAWASESMSHGPYLSKRATLLHGSENEDTSRLARDADMEPFQRY
jgi:hypothetical protein